MISLDEALTRILALVPPVQTERVATGDCGGRVLASPVKALVTQPPFDASAMDGYALRSADGKTGTHLKVIGTSQAGQRYAGSVAAGECVRIFTGAPVPEGADAVIMQERVVATTDGAIELQVTIEAGQSIRKRGQDFAEEQVLIKAGTRLDFRHLALAAAANHGLLDVTIMPRLGLLATGDELVKPGGTPAPDQIIASNSVALAALFAPLCARVTDFGLVGDDPDKLEAAVAAALGSDADVIVTTGGASVGDHDLVQPALLKLGVKIDFWRLAMRPGKPLMFGTYGKKLVFGLPGNPISALVTALVAVAPALRKFAGQSEVLGPRLRLPLATGMVANGERQLFQRCRLAAGPSGTFAEPLGETDSAHLSSFAEADGLIVRMAHAAVAEVGEIVEVLPLR